ncbi:hypothetical protein EGW08_002263, partial [Elysia chlorotica]
FILLEECTTKLVRLKNRSRNFSRKNIIRKFPRNPSTRISTGHKDSYKLWHKSHRYTLRPSSNTMADNQVKEAETEWTNDRVQELVEQGLQPLKTEVQEIKVTMAEVVRQLREIRKDLKWMSTPRLEGRALSTQGSPWLTEQESRQEGAAVISTTHQGEERGKVSADCDSQPQQQIDDLGSELVWFKNKVELLQEKFQQQKVRQEDILSSVKAHCAFTEGVIREASISKTSREPTESAVEMSSGENLRQDGCEESAGAKDTTVQLVVAANKKLIDGAVERLEALTIGQSQRIVDKIRNPSSDNQSIFHFFIPHFENLIGSDESVCSCQYHVDFRHTFMVVRGVARFSAESSHMTVGLEQTMDALELGLEKGRASLVDIKARIKAPKDSGLPDIEMDGVSECCGGDSPQTDENGWISLGQPVVSMKQLLDAGYNTHKDTSLLIEFEINAKPQQRSLLTLLTG